MKMAVRVSMVVIFSKHGGVDFIKKFDDKYEAEDYAKDLAKDDCERVVYVLDTVSAFQSVPNVEKCLLKYADKEATVPALEPVEVPVQPGLSGVSVVEGF